MQNKHHILNALAEIVLQAFVEGKKEKHMDQQSIRIVKKGFTNLRFEKNAPHV